MMWYDNILRYDNIFFALTGARQFVLAWILECPTATALVANRSIQRKQESHKKPKNILKKNFEATSDQFI